MLYETWVGDVMTVTDGLNTPQDLYSVSPILPAINVGPDSEPFWAIYPVDVAGKPRVDVSRTCAETGSAMAHRTMRVFVEYRF